MSNISIKAKNNLQFNYLKVTTKIEENKQNFIAYNKF